MSITADFEAGTLGATIAQTDVGSATQWDSVGVNTNAAATYDNTHVAHGNQSLKIVTNSVGSPCRVVLAWSTTAFGTHTDHYGRLYIYPTTSFAVDELVEFLSGGTGGSLVAALNVNASNQLTLRDSTGTGPTTTHGLTLNAWNRIEYHIVHSATVGQMECQLFLGSNFDGTTPDETLSSTATLNTGASADTVKFGLLSNEPNLTYWLDDLMAGATTWPGPAVTVAPAITAPYLGLRIPNSRVGPTALRNRFRFRAPEYSFTVTSTQFNDAPVGSIILAGSNVEAQSRTASLAGTITLGGSITEALSHNTAVAGSITLSGSLVASQTNSDARSGTITLGGTRTESLARSGSPSGTITLGGARVDGLTHSTAPVGAITLGGSIVAIYGYVSAPSGVIALSGSLSSTTSAADTEGGMFFLDGSIVESNSGVTTPTFNPAIMGRHHP